MVFNYVHREDDVGLQVDLSGRGT